MGFSAIKFLFKPVLILQEISGQVKCLPPKGYELQLKHCMGVIQARSVFGNKKELSR